ncbi:serine/threonine-protein kinase, partial [Catellatospora sp. NPDC049609]|uniref:serine/threonine-protein kinase n=1 Tax=Catellatospora sp. NPDC049609 TaxID=3155505 RepID=UPI00343283D7
LDSASPSSAPSPSTSTSPSVPPSPSPKLRVPIPKLLTDELALRRLRTEAQALARLRHPHIAEVYDYGVIGARRLSAAYLAMELIDGQSLTEVLGEQIHLDWPVAVTFAAQIAAALAAAHARGIVHRDIAPSNVLLAADGAKVIDFGLCAPPGSDDLDPGGYLAGTPAYLAPERIDDPQPLVRPTADVYALGVLLYRMLSGDLPWHAESALDLLTAPQTQQPRPLPPIAGLPAAVADTITACLARDPAGRPTAQQLAAVLAEHAPAASVLRTTLPAADGGDEQDVHTHLLPWRTPPARRSRRPALVAGVLGVGAVAAAAWAWNSSATRPPAASAAAPSPAVSAPPPCAVVYRLGTDDGSRFSATLTIANTTTSTLAPGRLTVQMPGTQQVEPARGWQQRDHTATAAIGPLAGGDTTDLPLTATYRGTNPLPTAFSLDGVRCALTLLGPSGQPIDPPPPAPDPTAAVGPAAPGPGLPPATGSGPGLPASAPAPSAAGPGQPPAPPGKPTARPSPVRPSKSPQRADDAGRPHGP